MAKRRRFTAKFKARVALDALREERTGVPRGVRRRPRRRRCTPRSGNWSSSGTSQKKVLQQNLWARLYCGKSASV